MRTLADPVHQIVVSALADSSVNITVRGRANAVDYWSVHFDLTEKVKLAFDQQGIPIPFPQQDMHMQQAD